MDFTQFYNALIGILNGMSPYILLGFLVAGILHAFVRPSAMSRHLGGRGIGPVFKAALFGIPLPLCSCGVLPAAVSLYRRGASRGATTSFLIATPQTGVDSIAATYSLLGSAFAVARPIAALVGSVAGGYAVDRSDKTTASGHNQGYTADEEPLADTFGGRVVEALRYGFVDMVASVGKWLVFGLIIAALITVFVPDSFFISLSHYPLLAMLAVVAVAIPMYICATGSIPIALSLMLKGLSPGIAFVMLMAGPAANFASIILLSRTYGRKATMIYVGSVVVTAIAFGLAIDLLLPASWFAPTAAMHACCGHADAGIFDSICSVVLCGLLVYTSLKNYKHKKQQLNLNQDMEQIFKIDGMSCPHCSARVEKTIQALEGVDGVVVDLSAGTARVTGDTKAETIAEAVRLAGYDCTLI